MACMVGKNLYSVLIWAMYLIVTMDSCKGCLYNIETTIYINARLTPNINNTNNNQNLQL